MNGHYFFSKNTDKLYDISSIMSVEVSRLAAHLDLFKGEKRQKLFANNKSPVSNDSRTSFHQLWVTRYRMANVF